MNTALALMLACALGAASPQADTGLSPAFDEAMESGDSAGAIVAAQELVDDQPRDPHAHFAMARALAMDGDVEAAAEALRSALSLGFVDLHRLVHDPVFEDLREHDLCVWLFANWRERLDARGVAESGALARALGDEYRIVSDEALRVHIITALDAELTGYALEELTRVARFGAGLFPEASEERPDPWVLVLLPTPEHADRLIPQANAGGVYDHARKGLVVRDIGPSLRHEFFHALHWRHMERLGQTHPIWIREGLATLVEDIEIDGDDLTIVPSWRTNIAKRLAKIRRLRPWDDFVGLTPKRFTRTRPVSNYAQSRALMHWLHDTGRLAAWYEAFTSNFEHDPSGLTSVDAVTGSERHEWGDDLRTWLLAQKDVGVPGRRNPVGLGIRLRPGVGDGPVIDASGHTSVGGVRLRPRDVIRSVEGLAVRTLNELYRELGKHRAGDRVRISLDRGGRTVEAEIELVREEDLLGLG